MGFNLNLLKTSPISSTKSLLFTTTTTTRPTFIFSSLLTWFPPTVRLSSSSSLKPVARSISSSGFNSFHFHHSKLSFRGGVFIAMAASGSVQKSEEEWRAVLSPEQFRILRLKGTEYDLFSCLFYKFIIYAFV